jgi:YHS domain-containing protein
MAVYLHRRTAFKVLAAVGVFQLLTRKPLRSEEVPLAIKGYDPVAYFTDGKPIKGSPQYEADWDNNRYQFASVEHLAIFKSDPTHYAPQFGRQAVHVWWSGWGADLCARPRWVHHEGHAESICHSERVISGRGYVITGKPPHGGFLLGFFAMIDLPRAAARTIRTGWQPHHPTMMIGAFLTPKAECHLAA